MRSSYRLIAAGWNDTCTMHPTESGTAYYIEPFHVKRTVGIVPKDRRARYRGNWRDNDE